MSGVADVSTTEEVRSCEPTPGLQPQQSCQNIEQSPSYREGYDATARVVDTLTLPIQLFREAGGLNLAQGTSRTTYPPQQESLLESTAKPQVVKEDMGSGHKSFVSPLHGYFGPLLICAR
jgi:hypothetical protein